MSDRLRGISTGRRLAVAVVVGLVAAALTVRFGDDTYAPSVGWDIGALTVLTWVWATVWPMSSEATARFATREDPTRPVSDITLLSASVVSLAAVVTLLIGARSGHGTERDVTAALGVATETLAWLVIHTVYALRYAELYYSGADGGIDFNQGMPPRYSDFAYLAFTLGMTYQVSDTDLRTPVIRATALRHGLLSYLFGAVILATTINLIAGLGSA